MAVPRAKKKKDNSLIKMTMQEYRKFKAEIQEFVMKRAFLIVIASFYDTADLKWRDYFKSKKKKDEFLDMAIKRVEVYKGHVDQRKVLHIDEIADMVHKRTGIDYRTYWAECARDDSERLKQELRNDNRL